MEILGIGNLWWCWSRPCWELDRTDESRQNHWGGLSIDMIQLFFFKLTIKWCLVHFTDKSRSNQTNRLGKCISYHTMVTCTQTLTWCQLGLAPALPSKDKPYRICQRSFSNWNLSKYLIQNHKFQLSSSLFSFLCRLPCSTEQEIHLFKVSAE